MVKSLTRFLTKLWTDSPKNKHSFSRWSGTPRWLFYRKSDCPILEFKQSALAGMRGEEYSEKSFFSLYKKEHEKKGKGKTYDRPGSRKIESESQDQS